MCNNCAVNQHRQCLHVGSQNKARVCGAMWGGNQQGVWCVAKGNGGGKNSVKGKCSGVCISTKPSVGKVCKGVGCGGVCVPGMYVAGVWGKSVRG